MNAVLEKPPAKARGRKVASFAPVPAQTPANSILEDSALFAEVGDFLAQASGTDEDHAFSGESDRLLSIGAMIAFDAAKGHFSNSNAENTVYDIAACINSARLVPGDDESVERTLHINNAAERLAIIAGMPVHQMIFTDVPRPSREAAPAPSPTPLDGKQFSQEQLKELFWQAHLHMDCARHVLNHYADEAGEDVIFAFRDLLNAYLSETEARLDRDEVGTLTKGDLPDASTSICKLLTLTVPYATEHDDGVLHGVNYLLTSAKRITDGDLGVLG
ncbi:hypothetical protein WH367_19230 [Comamonas sp. MYb21]|uniref:hypothetical protein n=1 Tax=Comamonas sp. MYb21 TaxID=1848648 RepID=UPI0030A6CE7A